MNLDRWDARPYLQRGLDVTSQFVNVWFFNGMTDESVSGRAYKSTTLRAARGLPVKRRWRFVAAVAEFIFWRIDKGQHCQSAFWQDIDRAGIRWSAAKKNTTLAHSLSKQHEAI